LAVFAAGFFAVFGAAFFVAFLVAIRVSLSIYGELAARAERRPAHRKPGGRVRHPSHRTGAGLLLLLRRLLGGSLLLRGHGVQSPLSLFSSVSPSINISVDIRLDTLPVG
jgi:hypothetical protein